MIIRRANILFVSVGTLLLSVPTYAWAGSPEAQPPTWWQIDAGILAIPVAVVGMIFTFFQIRKVHIDTRKAHLESVALEAELRGKGLLENKGKPQASFSKPNAVREKFMMVYGFFPTAVVTIYTVLFRATSLLPVPPSVANAILAVILPVFAAQLTLIALWIRNHRSSPLLIVRLPLWTVCGPPLALLLFSLGVCVLISGHSAGDTAGMGESPMMLPVVAICAALLGSSTVQTTSVFVSPLRKIRAVDLSSAFNRIGIHSDGNSFGSGGLDGGGKAYSFSQLSPEIVWNGFSFKLGHPDALNVVSCVGQMLQLPDGRFGALMMLAAGVNGNQPAQKFKIHYADGTEENPVSSISDWWHPQLFPGEHAATITKYNNKSDGTREEGLRYLYGYVLSLDPKKNLKTITLPNNVNIELLALTATAGGVWTQT